MPCRCRIVNIDFPRNRTDCFRSCVTVIVMMPEQQQERAEAFAQALARRNLTINAASLRLNINRQTLTKMSNGLPVELEVIERFAEGLGLDVNAWRELWGFLRVRDTRSLADRFQELVYELEMEIEAKACGGHGAAVDLEALRRAVEDIRREERGLAE